MDFMLPDDDTMEIMRREFDSLKRGENARTFAFADNEKPLCRSGANGGAQLTYLPTALLLLYFVKHMSYNTGYGTQIFDTDGGLAQLQRVGSNFRQLNDLG